MPTLSFVPFILTFLPFSLPSPWPSTFREWADSWKMISVTFDYIQVIDSCSINQVESHFGLSYDMKMIFLCLNLDRIHRLELCIWAILSAPVSAVSVKKLFSFLHWEAWEGLLKVVLCEKYACLKGYELTDLMLKSY